MERIAVFKKKIKDEFAPKLRKAGFKGTGNLFYRRVGHLVNIVSIETYKYGGECAIELGLAIDFLDSGLYEPQGRPFNIKNYGKELYWRLVPNDKNDRWYKWGQNDEETDSEIDSMINDFFTYAEPEFSKFDSLDSILKLFSLQDILQNSWLKLDLPNASISSARAALLCARIFEFEANLKLCSEYALAGMSHCVENGVGSALIPSFKKLVEKACVEVV